MIYLGTHDMNIYCFTKCLIKDDLRYMEIGWNERDEIKIHKDAQKTWDDIFDQYSIKTSNNDTELYYQLVDEIDYLKRRFIILEVLIRELTEDNRDTYGKEIKAWGFAIKPIKIYRQIKDFERQFRIAKQDIELKEDDLAKVMEENDSGEPMNLYKKKVKLERITGLKIDLKTCVIDEWVEILNEAEEINIENKKQMATNG